MGCDIHLYVEKLTQVPDPDVKDWTCKHCKQDNPVEVYRCPSCGSGDRSIKMASKWLPVENEIPNRYYGESWDQYETETISQRSMSKWDKGEPEGWSGINDVFSPGRRYNLFAILANVRNGRGFAGIPTGRGFKPISMPRGLPVDVSPEIKKQSDGHSHSWLAVQELLDYDWHGQTTVQYGTISKDQYKVFAATGNLPSSYYGYVSGGGVRTVDASEILATPDDGIAYFTVVEWSETYAEAVGKFIIEDWIPALESLGNPEQTRIIFWFDN